MSTKLFLRTLAGFIFIAFWISLPSVSFAQEGKWTAKADMPTARWALSTSVVDGKIYAISGRIHFTGAWTKSVEEYDPATDTWTKKADIPTARSWFSTSVVDGKIYAIDGWSKTNASPVEEYDPATDTWTQKTYMSIQGRWELATSAVGGKIYVIGGVNRAEVEEYDPSTDTWARKADMPTARGRLSASTVNGKIYAIGGYNWDSATNQEIVLSAVEEYDPATDTWTKKADMPMPTHEHTASVVNGKIYVMGGEGALTQTLGAAQTILSTIMKYDPVTDTWTKEGDMTVPRNGMSASVVDGRIYVMGGKEDAVERSMWGISTVEAYQPEPYPADGAESVELNVELSWPAGLGSVLYVVYFGNDFDDVNNATGGLRQEETTYTPGQLEFAKTYYWRVDELSVGRFTETHKGDVWSFTTVDFIVVDDFESYNDINQGEPGSNRVYLIWIDGLGNTTNGAIAGNLDVPLMAPGHNSLQAMPVSYDNAGKTSEVTRTLTSKKDWTEQGVTKLVLWFSGDAANAPDRMFVALGNAIVYHPDDAATQDSAWNEWVIDLQEFANQGADPTNVGSIAIGFGTRNAPVSTGGTGTVDIDDILLIR